MISWLCCRVRCHRSCVSDERSDSAGVPAGWRPEVRLDRGRLRKVERTPSGGVRVPAAVSRTGILEYRRADGEVVRELLPEEEIADADALQSLRDAAVTVGHPAGGTRMVTPDTYREDAVGHVTGEPAVDGGHLVAQLAIQDAETIRRIDAGELEEISAGYQLFIDPTPGVWNGQRYDQVQRRRRYNHVALLPKGAGRAGTTVALRLDGVDVAVQMAGESAATTRSKPTMEAKEKLAEFESMDMDKMKAQYDAEMASMKAERDALKAKLDEMTAKMAALEAPERTDAMVSARLELLDKARRVLGADFAAKRADGKSMTEREVQDAVLAKLRPERKWDEADAVYVQARFDAEMDLLSQAPSAPLTQARRDAFGARVEDVPSPHIIGREPPPDLSNRYRG